MEPIYNIFKRIFRPFFPQRVILKIHQWRGRWAAARYRYPAKRLTVIGVTGTDGKTTTCHLISSILQSTGYKVGMATTIDFQIGEEIRKNNVKMTTINPFSLQKLLREMVQADCRYAVIEVTAHAIAQFRVWGIPFHTVVLTNVTHDHLDYFGTLNLYRQTKEQLFANYPSISIINVDDPSAPQFLKYDSNSKVTYGVDKKADILARKILYAPNGTTFTLVSPKGQIPISLKIPGRFNVYNALAAISVGFAHQVSLENIRKGLENVRGVAGRMESISLGQNFTVLIDYAHTPDALKNVYETIKKGSRGKLIAVLGAAGDRDRTKRPILGELAARYCDYAIITNEDPYSENPESIIDQIASGIPHGRKEKAKYKKTQFKMFKVKGTGENYWWWRILDRKEAIAKALELAQRGDTVIITGKGAEEAMIVGNRSVPWSDRKITVELLEKLLKSPKSVTQIDEF